MTTESWVVAGPQTIEVEQVASLRVQLVGGRVDVVVLDVSTGTSSIGATTVSGDITVRLPQGRGVNVEARSVTGRVVVDGHDYKATMPGQTKVDLRSGDGACFVSTTSVSGHLTVLRGGGVA